jgi:ubiquinone/menaquinone biosynthesis C-methylase UbiE
MSEHEALWDASTYFVNAENAAEMARLMTLATQITEDMGGHFPPQLDPSSVHNVLDIACGPGQWIIDVARTYPHIQATGGDISQLMMAYASSLVQDLPNAHFQLMNAQQPLDFPDQSFDFIQARLISAFMLTSAWPQLLRECQRILRPGGTLCLIEGENLGMSNSAALEQYNALLAHAMRRAGHAFAPEGNMLGITPLLPRLLEQQGFQHITQRAFALNFSAGMKAHKPSYTINKTGMKLIQTFLIHWEVTTQAEIDIIFERALQDMRSPNFCGQFFYLAATGEKLFRGTLF